MLVAISIFGMALVIVLLCALYTVTRLIQHEYRFYREAWEEDGRPIGYMWRPREATWFGSSFAFHRCALTWVFRPPAWVSGDTTAEALLFRLRWLVLTWNVGFVALVIWLAMVAPHNVT